MGFVQQAEERRGATFPEISGHFESEGTMVFSLNIPSSDSKHFAELGDWGPMKRPGISLLTFADMPGYLFAKAI
jgi:hypothetical protein